VSADRVDGPTADEEQQDDERASAIRLLYPFGEPIRLSYEDQERVARVAAALASRPSADTALRARIEALVADYDATANKLCDDDMDEFAFAYAMTADRLRAALDEP
jgi:hypothetical protein